MTKIKSLILREHDTSFGGYKIKFVAQIEIDAIDFKKLKGVLGGLVIEVNNHLCKQYGIPTHSPTIDGIRLRAKNKVKTLTFTYFSNDTALAERMGMRMIKTSEGLIPEWGSVIDLLEGKAA